jgi:hypothetical protein
LTENYEILQIVEENEESKEEYNIKEFYSKYTEGKKLLQN